MSKRTPKKQAEPTLGDRVRVARVHLNLSRAELAELVGCDPSKVWRVEQQDATLRSDEIMGWATALGVSIAQLYGEEPLVFGATATEGSTEAAR